MYRNRRRLVLFLMLWIVIFGLLMLSLIARLSIGDWVEDLIVSYLLGGIAAIFTLILMIAAILIIRFVPSWRGTLEGFSWSMPFGIFLFQMFDRFEQDSLIAQHPFVVCMLTYYVMGQVLSKLPILRLFRLRSKGRFVSHDTAQQLWDKHLPAPNAAYLQNSPLTASITIDPDDPMCRNVSYDYGKITSHYRLQFQALDAPRSFAYDMYAIGTTQCTGTFSTVIADHDSHRDVALTFVYHRLTPLIWLHTWCDDLMGQEADHYAAVEAGVEDLSVIKLMHDAAAKSRASKPAAVSAVPA